jgi:hypothetical protein
MKRKRKDFLKGNSIIISEHALKRCLIRTEVMTEEEYLVMKELADQGDKEAIEFFKAQKKTFEIKFRRSTLSKLMPSNVEKRREVGGPKPTRCVFIAEKRGRTFIMVTAYLQGRKEDFWKVQTDSEEVKNIG